MSEPLVSVVIVNYKVPLLLEECLRSLRATTFDGGVEVIVVDNASGDNSRAMVESGFPEVAWIGLKSNIGFGKASNLGARRATGRYLLLLNPDTVVREDTVATCVDFLKAHPQCGLMGPKIMNSDGSLQVSCRRGFPTPMVALYRMTGLSRLFPRSRRFGRYNLTYLDPDQDAQVDAISGSFMFLPRELFLELGGFDERFFMYGEDLDLCQRVHERGYEVWYHPGTQIVHFKGRSSAKSSIRSRAAFYEAMIIFSRKYRHLHESFLPGWLIYVGIVVQAAMHIGASLTRSMVACIVDLVLINAVLWAGISLRFALLDMGSPYAGGWPTAWMTIAAHFLLSDIYVFTFWYRGVYSRSRYSVGNAVWSGLIASGVFFACVYFVNQLAFSRVAFLGSALVLAALLPAWRELLPRVVGRLRQLTYATGAVLVIGGDEIARRLVMNVEKDRTARIAGIIWPEQTGMPVELLGYPVLGPMSSLRQLLEVHRADLLLVATAQPWYSHVIEALSSRAVRNLTIRWVPREVLAMAPERVPETVPLHDFRL